MADRLYLSLWYPNFRLEALPAALAGVLRQFAVIGQKRVSAAASYPIAFSEAPVYQRVYVVTDTTPDGLPIDASPDATIQRIEEAVAEATEQLHDDMAWEFEMRWQLWVPEEVADEPTDEDDDAENSSPSTGEDHWRLRTHTVRILGFGPTFDTAGFEQNGHILVDFGPDHPWVPAEDPDAPHDSTDKQRRLSRIAQGHIQQNIEKLLAFTLLVEKNCGISSRLLWTESGEPLAEKLIARLQRVN